VSVVVRKRNGKRIVVTRKPTKATRQQKTGSNSFPRPNLPDKPKVTVGAKCYGRTKKGGYIVVRFFISQWRPGLGSKKIPKGSPWFVVDLDEGKHYAEGTKSSGYPKDKAIKVARQYRDEYGAWTTMPF
jgi:hypothetical protein